MKMMGIVPSASLALDIFPADPVLTPCETIRNDLDPFFVPHWLTLVQSKYLQEDKCNYLFIL